MAFMSLVKSLIDANCLNLLRKKQSLGGTWGGWAGDSSRTQSGVRTDVCLVSLALIWGGLLEERAAERQVNPPFVLPAWPLPARWMACARE